MNTKPLIIGDLTAPVPVIQGGMGVGVSLHRLAGAVAAQGGVGILSAAQIGYAYPGFEEDPVGTNLKAVGEEIRKARETAGGGVVGINIMVATRRYNEYVRAAVEAGADLIISGAGLPMTLPELTAGSRTKIAPIVSGLKSVQVILKYWKKKYDRLPDLVVIEGPLAGGHLGFSPEQLADIEALDYDTEVEAILRFVREWAEQYAAETGRNRQIPVVMAGGIYSREDMEHYLELGADGVQIATRFVTTYECDASPDFKQAYLDADQEDIMIVHSPVGMPGRALRNAFIERTCAGRIPHGKCHTCITTCKPDETPYCITEALVNAVKGKTGEGLIFCGANAYRAHDLEHVKDIMDEFR